MKDEGKGAEKTPPEQVSGGRGGAWRPHARHKGGNRAMTCPLPGGWAPASGKAESLQEGAGEWGRGRGAQATTWGANTQGPGQHNKARLRSHDKAASNGQGSGVGQQGRGRGNEDSRGSWDSMRMGGGNNKAWPGQLVLSLQDAMATLAPPASGAGFLPDGPSACHNREPTRGRPRGRGWRAGQATHTGNSNPPLGAHDPPVCLCHLTLLTRECQHTSNTDASTKTHAHIRPRNPPR